MRVDFHGAVLLCVRGGRARARWPPLPSSIKLKHVCLGDGFPTTSTTCLLLAYLLLLLRPPSEVVTVRGYTAPVCVNSPTTMAALKTLAGFMGVVEASEGPRGLPRGGRDLLGLAAC